MRALLKIILALAGIVVLILLATFCLFYFYSRDLPDIADLAKYAPASVTQVSDERLGPSVAVPYNAIGVNVRNAIGAVEAREDDPSVLEAELFHAGMLRRRTLAAAVSGTMYYPPQRTLVRQLTELRTAIRLERTYSRQQLFTMFANRSYFGPRANGVEDASKFYFRAEPRDLSLSEAALLAALLGSPTYYSPATHPDRALQRRNDVLDAMVAKGSITAEEAERAKAAPLGVVPNTSTAAQ